MVKLMFYVILLAALPLALLSSCHMLENPKSSYATIAEARQAGAIGPDGWLPELLLPDDAINIIEQHNIDSNDRWLTYAFTGTAPVGLPNCKDTDVDLDTVDAPRWWQRSVASIGSEAKTYTCGHRSELGGYWVDANCVLVIGSSQGAWGCHSERMIPK
jgi:hypothetical protein